MSLAPWTVRKLAMTETFRYNTEDKNNTQIVTESSFPNVYM